MADFKTNAFLVNISNDNVDLKRQQNPFPPNDPSETIQKASQNQFSRAQEEIVF